MTKTALAYGHYESETFDPGRKYPKIQIVSVEDIFTKGWRGLEYPGSNTSRRSEPPVAGDAFKPKPSTRKTAPKAIEKAAPDFKLKPSELRKAPAKQHALKLKVPGAKGGK
jgi:hypothetical protein